jgi:hypothetical protein
MGILVRGGILARVVDMAAARGVRWSITDGLLPLALMGSLVGWVRVVAVVVVVSPTSSDRGCGSACPCQVEEEAAEVLGG